MVLHTDVRVRGLGHFSVERKKSRKQLWRKEEKSCYTGKPTGRTQKNTNKGIQANMFAGAMVFATNALRPYCPASAAKNLVRTQVSVKVPNFQFGSQKLAINQAFN